jgi:hypothetical protein
MAIAEPPIGFPLSWLRARRRPRLSAAFFVEPFAAQSGERGRLQRRNRLFDLPGLWGVTLQPVEPVGAQQNEMDQQREDEEKGEQRYKRPPRIE